MAERSFAKEVESLRLGAGETFEGEAILAVTKALLQAGVGYVGGYQGAPVSHLMDVLADARGILDDLGVHFESSASEATAAAMLAASINYPIRGAVTWKSTVGTNVASDALSNLASAGVNGGAMIILGEDYGEGASIMQERTHAFAMKSQMWLLDPRPDLPTIVRLVEQGFELSEASNTPVMLMMRIRACHMHGRFVASDNRRPSFTGRDALASPRRSYDRIILPPSTYLQEREKIEQRWPAAVEYIRRHALNESHDGDLGDIGIVLQGGLYNTVLRALERLGLADVFGRSRIPLYVLNVTYPLVPDEVTKFAAGKTAILVVEEGQPEYLEQALSLLLRQADCQARVVGKGPLPIAGEYTGAVLKQGLERFLGEYRPDVLRAAQPAARPAASPAEPRAVRSGHPIRETPLLPAASLKSAVPARPSGLCTGCPERPLFTAMKLIEREDGPLHVSADIGCHSFATLPPFDLGASIMGYGLGAAGAAAFGNTGGARRPIALMGDGGFWHNGLTSGIGNAVFNRHDSVTIIVDNGYSAATGGQYILSSRADVPGRKSHNPIEKAVRGVGVEWVRRVHTYDMKETLGALREALSTPQTGPKVIIAEGECELNRERRLAPQVRKRIEQGERMVRQRFGVDEDVCTGDHSCIRLSGCPSLTIKPSTDPLKTAPVAHVDNSCVGCGVCGEVAHAAVLCPSFYRADIISNPTRWDRAFAGVRASVIGWLSR
ncbi:MAG TPA: indolepyruvate ferredoxin oxidoreductase subunit alpha [Steroidobacteraceae bacterium]